MTISGSSTSSLLDSVLSSKTTQQEIDVTVLKKAQDAAKQQGEALIQMIDQSGPNPQTGRLDTYA